jgi:hypothetical protein
MRRSLSLVGALCLAMSAPTAGARDAPEFKVSDAAILRCVETAERSSADRGDEEARDCIGRETATCLGTLLSGSPSVNALHCTASEAAAWHEIAKKAYATLLVEITKEDKNRPNGAQASLPALQRTHELWQQAAAEDCVFARLRPAEATMQSETAARCWRDKHGERALLYRRWLRGLTY